LNGIVSHRKQRKSTRNLQGIGLSYEFRRRIIKGSDLGHRPLAFINERRAINLDPNCGWARGKTGCTSQTRFKSFRSWTPCWPKNRSSSRPLHLDETLNVTQG